MIDVYDAKIESGYGTVEVSAQYSYLDSELLYKSFKTGYFEYFPEYNEDLNCNQELYELINEREEEVLEALHILSVGETFDFKDFTIIRTT